jgi:hypothetical protein
VTTPSRGTRRLLPEVSLFHGVVDENILMLFSRADGDPDRFARVSKQEWASALEDAASQRFSQGSASARGDIGERFKSSRNTKRYSHLTSVYVHIRG